MSQQIIGVDFSDSLRGKMHHDWNRRPSNRRFDSEQRKITGDVHNHPTFTKRTRISTATAKAPSSAEINRRMRDLRANQTRLQKAVGTMVMGYRPTTSGAQRRAAVDYARRSLDPLTRGISTTFQLDQKRLETVLLAKKRRRDGCIDDPQRTRLFNDFRRKRALAASLKSKSKAGATNPKRERMLRKRALAAYLDFKFKAGASKTQTKTAAARPRVARKTANRHETQPVKPPDSTTCTCE